MKVTEEAWAAQVERGDNAEMREASAYIGIEQVLREHDECLCRHCKRILGNVLKAREMHPLWIELGKRPDLNSGGLARELCHGCWKTGSDTHWANVPWHQACIPTKQEGE